MADMVRKQVYIEARQDELLKRWAEETGESEAEIFRKALDRWFASEQQPREAKPAWEQVQAFVQERADREQLPVDERGRARSCTRNG